MAPTKRVAAVVALAALAAFASAVGTGRLYGTIQDTAIFCARPPAPPARVAATLCVALVATHLHWRRPDACIASAFSIRHPLL